MTAADVDREAAARDLAEADKQLAAWKGELDGAYHALVLKRGWAQARLDVGGAHQPHEPRANDEALAHHAQGRAWSTPTSKR